MEPKSNVTNADFTASKDVRIQKAPVSRGSTDLLLLLLFLVRTVGHSVNTAAEPHGLEARFKEEGRQTDTQRR